MYTVTELENSGRIANRWNLDFSTLLPVN